MRRKAGDDADEVLRNIDEVKDKYVKHEPAEAGGRSTAYRAQQPESRN